MSATMGEFTLGDAMINITGRVAPTLNQSLGYAETQIKNKFGNILKVTSAIGQGMTVAGTAIIGALGYAAKGAADFDEALHKVNTVAKLSDADLKALGDKTLALSDEMGVGAVDALNAMYQALSAGIPADNVIDFMRTAAKASIGGIADLEQVVDGVTSAVNAYKASGLEAGKASDIMFKSAELGKTTFGELAASMSNVAPVAANAGISFEEVNAAIAQLTLSGTKTAEATTQIRAAMLALINPNETMKLALHDLGFASGEAMLKQLGLVGAMQKLGTVQNMETTKTAGLKDTIEKLGDQYLKAQQKLAELGKQMPKTAKDSESLARRKSELIKKMGELQKKTSDAKEEYTTFAVNGNEGIAKALGSVEALGLYLGATGANAQGMATIMDGMKNSAGAADSAFNEMNKAANRQFETLKVNLGNLRIEIGQKIMPVINRFIKETVIPMVGAISEWIKRNPQLTETLLRVAAGVGAIFITLGPLLMMLPGIITFFTTFSKLAFLLYGGALKSLIGLAVMGGGGLLGFAWALAYIVGVAGIGWKIGTWINEMIDVHFPKLAKGIDDQCDKLVSWIDKWRELLGLTDTYMNSGIKGELGPGVTDRKSNTDLLNGGTVGTGFDPVPKLAKGTKSAPGGWAWVGEKGPELVNLPRGSQVIPADQSARMAGGASVGQVTVNINTSGDITPAKARQIGKMIFSEMARAKA